MYHIYHLTLLLGSSLYRNTSFSLFFLPRFLSFRSRFGFFSV